MGGLARLISMEGHDMGEDVTVIFAGPALAEARIQNDPGGSATPIVGTVDTGSGALLAGVTNPLAWSPLYSVPVGGGSFMKLRVISPPNAFGDHSNTVLDTTSYGGLAVKAVIPRSLLNTVDGTWLIALWRPLPSPALLSEIAALPSQGTMQERATLAQYLLSGALVEGSLSYDATTGVMVSSPWSPPTASFFYADGGHEIVPASSGTITLNGTVLSFPSGSYADQAAWLAGIQAFPGVAGVQMVEGWFGIQATPGAGVLEVSSYSLEGTDYPVTQSHVGTDGSNDPRAWVQFYSDKECTVPHTGPMGTALGRKRLSAAPT